MPDYRAISKDLYERFHDAFEKLYVSELKDQIADKDEVITAQDHMIAEQDARIAQLEAALRGLLEVCPCQNGCPPDDMTCATNAARAALGEERT